MSTLTGNVRKRNEAEEVKDLDLRPDFVSPEKRRKTERMVCTFMTLCSMYYGWMDGRMICEYECERQCDCEC